MAYLISDSLVLEATRGTCTIVHGQIDATTAVCGSRESCTRYLRILGSGAPLLYGSPSNPTHPCRALGGAVYTNSVSRRVVHVYVIWSYMCMNRSCVCFGWIICHEFRSRMVFEVFLRSLVKKPKIAYLH